jgi:hypothetical protein
MNIQVIHDQMYDVGVRVAGDDIKPLQAVEDLGREIGFSLPPTAIRSFRGSAVLQTESDQI